MIRRACGPFGSGNNASVALAVIEADEDLVLDECAVIVCADADLALTLPTEAPEGTFVTIVADGGDVVVIGASTPQTVRRGSACTLVRSCEGRWIAECCCPAAAGTGVTGPTGPRGPQGIPGPTGAAGSAAAQALLRTAIAVGPEIIQTKTNDPTFSDLVSTTTSGGPATVVDIAATTSVNLLNPAPINANFELFVDGVLVSDSNIASVSNNTGNGSQTATVYGRAAITPNMVHTIALRWNVPTGSAAVSPQHAAIMTWETTL